MCSLWRCQTTWSSLIYYVNETQPRRQPTMFTIERRFHESATMLTSELFIFLLSTCSVEHAQHSHVLDTSSHPMTWSVQIYLIFIYYNSYFFKFILFSIYYNLYLLFVSCYFRIELSCWYWVWGCSTINIWYMLVLSPGVFNPQQTREIEHLLENTWMTITEYNGSKLD